MLENMVELTAANETLETQLDAAKTSSTNNNVLVTTLNARVLQLLAEKEVLSTDLTECLLADADKFTKLKTSITLLEGALDTQKTSATKMASENTTLSTGINTTAAEKKELETKVTKLTDQQKQQAIELAKLTAESIKLAADQVASLKKEADQLAILKTEADQVARLTKEVANVQAELQAANAKNDKNKLLTTVLLNQKKKDSKQQADAASFLTDINRKFATKTAESIKLAADLDSLEKKTARLERELDTQKTSATKMASENTTLSSKLAADLKDANDTKKLLLTEVTYLQKQASELADIQGKFEKQTESSKLALEQVASLNTEVGSLTKELNLSKIQHTTDSKQQASKLADIQGKFEKQTESSKLALEQVASLNTEVGSLTKELKLSKIQHTKDDKEIRTQKVHAQNALNAKQNALDAGKEQKEKATLLLTANQQLVAKFAPWITNLSTIQQLFQKNYKVPSAITDATIAQLLTDLLKSKTEVDTDMNNWDITLGYNSDDSDNTGLLNHMTRNIAKAGADLDGTWINEWYNTMERIMTSLGGPKLQPLELKLGLESIVIKTRDAVLEHTDKVHKKLEFASDLFKKLYIPFTKALGTNHAKDNAQLTMANDDTLIKYYVDNTDNFVDNFNAGVDMIATLLRDGPKEKQADPPYDHTGESMADNSSSIRNIMRQLYTQFNDTESQRDDLDVSFDDLELHVVAFTEARPVTIG
jgi:hypothetical protein